MNRIKLGFLAESATSLVDNGSLQEPGKLACTELPAFAESHGGRAVFLPLSMEHRYRYPVVVWLHGDGEGVRQLWQIMPGISDRNYIGIGIPGAMPAESAEGAWTQSPSAIETASRQVQKAIQLLRQKYNINERRVFVAGAGSGGTMAFRIAFRLPHLFLGAASLDGPVPGNLLPLGNVRRSREIPLFWGHSRESNRLPESHLCEQLRLLYVAGFDVTLRQYAGDSHMTDHGLPDLNTWMMERVSGQPDSNIIC
jgi:phospholipase/carboxylesterase